LILSHTHTDLKQCAVHITKGFALGAIVLGIPLTLRGKNNMKKAISWGILLGGFRFLDCFIWNLREGKLAFLSPSTIRFLGQYQTGF
jgi:hypothetical protein